MLTSPTDVLTECDKRIKEHIDSKSFSVFILRCLRILAENAQGNFKQKHTIMRKHDELKKEFIALKEAFYGE